MGLEPTMLYSGLKVRAVRHYGNRSVSCSAASSMDYKLYNIKLISPVVETKGRTSKPTSDHLTPLAHFTGVGIEPTQITVLPLNYSHPVAGGHPLSTTGEISSRFNIPC